MHITRYNVLGRDLLCYAVYQNKNHLPIQAYDSFRVSLRNIYHKRPIMMLITQYGSAFQVNPRCFVVQKYAEYKRNMEGSYAHIHKE